MTGMIWDRERYIAHSLGEYTGREMLVELFGPLMALEDEWIKQGAAADEIAMAAFGFDYVLKVQLPGVCGAVTGIEPRVIEDTAEETLSVDAMGRRVRLCKKSATIPLPLEYPVKCMDDWLRIKKWYEFSEDRMDVDGLRRAKALRDRGFLTIQSVPGGFDEPRELMGEENLCIACYEEPELIHDMLNTIADTCVKLMERTGNIVPIDVVSIHEDMAGKSGPLFGPRQVCEFMQPYYKKIWDCARSFGARIFSQDSDGNMNPVIDAMIGCGVNCIYPCEPNSGMDIVEIRRKYGNRLCIKGGIDKFALRRDRAAIDRELEYKICAETLGGGVIFGLDHRIPNGVRIEDYRYYVKRARALLGLEPCGEKGWERMAF